MYSNDRNAYRQAYFTVWQKYQKKIPLDQLESQLLEIMLQHTEYYSVFENPNGFLEQEFTMEENPFLHLSLHLTINEQRMTNRPQGIKKIYKELVEKYQNEHEVQHRIMECVQRIMQMAQMNGNMPNDEEYLSALKGIE